MENKNTNIAAGKSENLSAPNHMDCDEFESYCIEDLEERTTLLKRMIEEKTPLHVILGARAYLSQPFALKNKEFLFEAPQDEVLRERFANTSQILVQTELDQVAVEFRLPKLFSDTFEKHAAYRAEIPERILRLQRRETFRINTQGYSSAFCKLTHNGKALNFSLLNLSVGGMAIESTSSDEAFAIGETIENAELSLPQTPPILISFQIRMLREEVVGVRKRTRLSCFFVNLKEEAEAQIAQCIAQLENATLRPGA